jgi:DNA replication protein DnaC
MHGLHGRGRRGQGCAEFLELIYQDALGVRQQPQIERHTQAADFRSLKPMDDLDWSFNPFVHKKEIHDLATCRFIREAKGVLFLGSSGVGKTHPARAIGYEAIALAQNNEKLSYEFTG